MTPSMELHPLFRWGVLLWLFVWLPVNLQAWGWQNMMHFCDGGAVIACVGIFMRLPLLFSSQAVGSLFVGVLWSLDIAWRLVTGHHLVGGTEYMWDDHYALWIRLLSTFHIGLPLALLWAMRKMGYDPRALALQSAIAAVLLILSRFLSPELNMNYAFRDPLFHRSWGPAPVHLTIIFAGTVALLYWPTHALLGKVFSSPAEGNQFAGSVVQENEE